MGRPTKFRPLDRFARSFDHCVLCGSVDDLVISHLTNQEETRANLRAEGVPEQFIPGHFDAAFQMPSNVTRLCRPHEEDYTNGVISKPQLCAAQRAAIEQIGPVPFLRYIYDEARAYQHCRDPMSLLYCAGEVSEFWRKEWRESPGKFIISPTRREAPGFHQHVDVETGMGGVSTCGGCPHCCETELNIPRWVPRR